MLNRGFDGNIIPCCYYKMISFGNVNENSLIEIWNKESLNLFRYLLLKKNGKIICNDCNISKYSADEKDNIDNCNDKLIKHYKV
mgnify:FL=1